MSIGAATLADLYEPAERGTMMGIYYWFVLGAASVLPQHGSPMLIRSAPLLGPSLGPILGGALTQGFNWRATFWFLTIFTGYSRGGIITMMTIVWYSAHSNS